MKLLLSSLFSALLLSNALAKDKAYTASTPAGPIVKSFLGISLTDSVDFIRWTMTMTDHDYLLECHYGIGKPNTNGFMEGGRKIKLTGSLKKENNHYQLLNGVKMLKLVEINSNLLHLADAKGKLLVGNGGWSYALNTLTPVPSNQLSLAVRETVFPDSMVYNGRTPCGVPGIADANQTCYKLKWRVILYANSKSNQPTGYKILGTPWRQKGGSTGNWIVLNKDSKLVYQLMDEKGSPFIHLLKLDENVVIFTDAKGNLLVGNHDFSYTLNKQ
jgi:hypothetical protein